MPKFDIVYILKEGIVPDELKYSLRSVEANFPHNKVWFVGGKPDGLFPDCSLYHRQYGETKWDMIKNSMLKVVAREELTDKFFLFNDDFFVMKPIKGEFINYADRTLTDRVEDFKKENGWLLPYARTLQKAREELKSLDKGEVNFDVHMPMLFEKAKVKSILQCSSPQMRSIYGNLNDCEYIEHKDVKICDLNEVPEQDADFLSTNEKSFADGKVGQFIRGVFSTPSRFETPVPKGV